MMRNIIGIQAFHRFRIERDPLDELVKIWYSEYSHEPEVKEGLLVLANLPKGEPHLVKPDFLDESILNIYKEYHL